MNQLSQYVHQQLEHAFETIERAQAHLSQVSQNLKTASAAVSSSVSSQTHALKQKVRRSEHLLRPIQDGSGKISKSKRKKRARLLRKKALSRGSQNLHDDLPGVVVVQSSQKALSFANSVPSCLDEGTHQHCRVYWVNASTRLQRSTSWDSSNTLRRVSGAAVAWQSTPGPVDMKATHWSSYTVFLPKVREPQPAELLAIALALSIALQEVQTAEEKHLEKPFHNVIVFSDCLPGLQRIRTTWNVNTGHVSRTKKPSYMTELQKVVTAATHLKNVGVNVQLHWVPGHSGVEGNHRAHVLSRIGARYPEVISKASTELVPSETKNEDMIYVPVDKLPHLIGMYVRDAHRRKNGLAPQSLECHKEVTEDAWVWDTDENFNEEYFTAREDVAALER